MTTDVPVSQPYRRLPPKQFEEVRQHLKGLMERGVTRESTSPYSSPIVLVRKSNGDKMMCVDYRRLNAVTRKDAFPLPRIDESLDALGGARIFSTLDLARGYHQVAMAEEDKSKTAFTTPLGLFEFNRMPFGLTGAPATFQRLMQSSMNDLVFKIMLVYLDDILVYAKTHMTRLSMVFARFPSTKVGRHGLNKRFLLVVLTPPFLPLFIIFSSLDITEFGFEIKGEVLSLSNSDILHVMEF